MALKKHKVGVVGCGKICGAYFNGMSVYPDALEIHACADLDASRAEMAAEEFKVPRFYSTDELLADPDIDIVLNLTVPKAHYDVAKAALKAGKHVYNEKPLAIKREHGRELLKLAAGKGLRIGAAPDTFMGQGIQTAIRARDSGIIGDPTAAVAVMASHGVEGWHPDPEFYYQEGGGPMFDMGPYYLTALVALLGPARRVTGATKKTFAERTIGSEPKRGKVIPVEIPTHLSGTVEFADGTLATLIMSFDVWRHSLPRIEIYGASGSLIVPDPNRFTGDVAVATSENREWQPFAVEHAIDENLRGTGIADMAYALSSGRPHRANGDLAYHVLDIMHAFHESAEQQKPIELESTCERPASLPVTLKKGELDL